MSGLLTISIIAGSIFLGLTVIGLLLSKLYKRASKEISFVRTGYGGQRVIVNGGTLVLPVLHEIIPVNMNTQRLEVRRSAEQALITRDRMRVDVLAEFYVRVQPTTESISAAAQTLGMRTMAPEQLKDLVEGKFVDALRAVAAEMAMTELHEQRVDFVQKVQQVVSEDLLKNGLELESVSLTGLDQTAKEYFNPDNAFDAEGLTRLTEEIESRKKRRNDIEQDTAVEIQTKNLEAERHKLDLSREQEYARMAQEREVEVRRASQVAEIAQERAEKQMLADQARIVAEREVDLSNITAEQVVEEERIEKEKRVREKAILKEQTIEAAEIDKQRCLDLANQDKAIAIAQKSREESEAKAEANKAKALAVATLEQVTTAEHKEQAERDKMIELIEAEKLAQKQAIGVTVAAEAEKQAALDQAESVQIIAAAQAEKVRIHAQAEADSEKLAANAAEVRYRVEAAGKLALNEASNLLSNDQVSMQVKLAIVKQLPEIIAESVKPMEQIEAIKIMQIDGLNSGHVSSSGQSSGAVSGSDGNLADQVVNSALRYRAQAPIVDSLLNEVGLSASDIHGFTNGLNEDMASKGK